jgi:hypothetical protein
MSLPPPPPPWYDALDAVPAENPDLQEGLWLKVAESNGAVVQDSSEGDVVLHSGHPAERVILTAGQERTTSAVAIADGKIDISRYVAMSNEVDILYRVIDSVNDEVPLLGTRFAGSNMSTGGLSLRAPPLETHADRPPLISTSSTADVSRSFLTSNDALADRARPELQPWPGEVRGQHYARLVTSGHPDSESSVQASYVELFAAGPSSLVDRAVTFGTSGTERMRIVADGRTGIGTSNPTALLTVENGDVHVQRSAREDPADSVVSIRHDVDYEGLTLSQCNDGSAMIRSRDGPMSIQASNAVTFCNDTVGFVAILSDAGNVGVAVPQPQYRVDIGGDARSRATMIGLALQRRAPAPRPPARHGHRRDAAGQHARRRHRVRRRECTHGGHRGRLHGGRHDCTDSQARRARFSHRARPQSLRGE